MTPEEEKKLIKMVKATRSNSRWTLVLVMVTLVCVLISIPPAQAQTLTFANSADISERDLNIYYPNYSTGQMDLFGRFNTTSVVEIDGNTSYTIDFVPIQSNPMDDPGGWLTNYAFPMIQSNAFAIILLIWFLVRKS